MADVLFIHIFIQSVLSSPNQLPELQLAVFQHKLLLSTLIKVNRFIRLKQGKTDSKVKPLPFEIIAFYFLILCSF
jgi:hypothetical protein